MRRYAIFARLGVGLMLVVFWGLIDSPLLGVIYILALCALSAIRYRLAAYRLLPILEAAVCICCALIWRPALLGLWLPAIGLLENRWELMEQELLNKDYEDRTERLKLEAMLDISAQDAHSAARLASVTERARIAQDIHDHVGHEISGAQIALQTAIKLYEKGDERTGELLHQSVRRLESASEHLRETVHNLKPAYTTDVESLEELCAAFDFCPAHFTIAGDMGGFVSWELLAANLKETLTNVARHSDATMVSVRLDGNTNFIRMTVTDNGKAAKAPPSGGLGLSGMKERVRAAGGTLTVNASDGFQVVCVLPKLR